MGAISRKKREEVKSLKALLTVLLFLNSPLAFTIHNLLNKEKTKINS
jgi:hypothetical protein